MGGHAIVSAARERLGWSREELGRRARVATRTISNVEAGGAPTVATLTKIADALGLSDDERAALLAPGAWSAPASERSALAGSTP